MTDYKIGQIHARQGGQEVIIIPPLAESALKDGDGATITMKYATKAELQDVGTSLETLSAEVVKKSGAQTIDGTKSFIGAVNVPDAVIAVDKHAVNGKMLLSKLADYLDLTKAETQTMAGSLIVGGHDLTNSVITAEEQEVSGRKFGGPMAGSSSATAGKDVNGYFNIKSSGFDRTVKQGVTRHYPLACLTDKNGLPVAKLCVGTADDEIRMYNFTVDIAGNPLTGPITHFNRDTGENYLTGVVPDGSPSTTYVTKEYVSKTDGSNNLLHNSVNETKSGNLVFIDGTYVASPMIRGISIASPQSAHRLYMHLGRKADSSNPWSINMIVCGRAGISIIHWEGYQGALSHIVKTDAKRTDTGNITHFNLLSRGDEDYISISAGNYSTRPNVIILSCLRGTAVTYPEYMSVENYNSETDTFTQIVEA